MNKVVLSKAISNVLRHNPQKLGLVLDEDGWTDLDKLLLALKKQEKFCLIQNKDVYEVVESSDKSRFEICGNKIRALYGHSIKQKIEKIPEKPPQYLYHGTGEKSKALILKSGLKPMGRQYIHLSPDLNMAQRVGKRRQKNPIILVIDAIVAWENGTIFYRGNDYVWLADYIDIKYLQEL